MAQPNFSQQKSKNKFGEQDRLNGGQRTKVKSERLKNERTDETDPPEVRPIAVEDLLGRAQNIVVLRLREHDSARIRLGRLGDVP